MTIRNDVIIDNRKVFCPNTSHLGFDKSHAKRGDFIVWRAGELFGMGRSLGRLTVEGTQDAYILVMALSQDIGNCNERWVNPKDVCQITDTHTAFAAWFFQAELPYPVDTMRKLMDHGTTSHLYIEKVPERVAMFRAREGV